MKRSDALTKTTKRHAAWRHVSADLVQRTDLGRQEIDVTGDRHFLYLNLKGAATSGENYLDGRRVPFAVRPEGSLSYIPPGAHWRGWDEGDNAAAYLLISVEEEFTGQFMTGSTTAMGLKPELGFKNLQLQFAARQIASQLDARDPASELMAEGYITAIFGHLLRRSGAPGGAAKGGLAPAVLKRITEKIEDELNRSIRLEELASDAGVSIAHFCRAFKQSTGLPPHLYLNKRRLERASDMLRKSDLSITDIAFACGYSSASHLSTYFRQQVGVSPLAYRSTWSRPDC